jgi:hypothetical protein
MLLIKLKEIKNKEKNEELTEKKLKLIYNYVTLKEETLKKEYEIKYDIKKEHFNEYYSNEAIQKGILLTRYVKFMKKIIKSDLKEKEIIKKEIKIFREYFINEMKEIGDKQLKKEIKKFDHIKYAKYENINEDSLGI